MNKAENLAETTERLQRRINKLRCNINYLNKGRKVALKQKIVELQELKSKMESAPTKRKKEIIKFIICTLITFGLVGLLGVLLASNSFNIGILLLLVSIMYSNIGILYHIGEINYIDKLLKNNNIEQINIELEDCNNLLQHIEATINQINKEIIKNKQIIFQCNMKKENSLAQNPQINLDYDTSSKTKVLVKKENNKFDEKR